MDLDQAVVSEKSVYCYSKSAFYHLSSNRGALSQTIYTELLHQAKLGMRYFITDLRNDFQLLVAESVLSMKQIMPSIKLVVSLPYLYGYWSGSFWTPNLLRCARRLYSSADCRCILQPEKIGPLAGPISLAEHTKYILSHCSVLIVSHCSDVGWLQKANQKYNCKTIMLKNNPCYLKDNSTYLAWPEPRTHCETLKAYFPLMINQKVVFLYFDMSANCRDFHKRLLALRQLLDSLLNQIVLNKVQKIIIPLINPIQVETAEIVLSFLKSYPAIHCATFLLHRVECPLFNWGEYWNIKAQKVYAAAHIKGYFGEPNMPTSFISSFYFYMLQFTSEIYYSFFGDPPQRSLLLQCASLLNVTCTDLGAASAKVMRSINIEMQTKLFLDYLFSVSRSMLIVKTIKVYLFELPEEKRLHTIVKYLKGYNQNALQMVHSIQRLL